MRRPASAVLAGSLAVALAAGALAAGALAARSPEARHTSDKASAPGALHGAWVVLHDDSAASDLPYALSADARAQRAPLDTDRPINPRMVQRIEDAGAHVRYASRWLRAVSVDADRATLARIARMPGVRAILPIRDAIPAAHAPTAPTAAAHALTAAAHAPTAAAHAPTAAEDSSFYGATWQPLEMLNIPPLHEIGLTGQGMRIAILDTGFLLRHEALVNLDVAAQRDFINGDDVVSNEPGEQTQPNPERHGTWVWSLLGGYAPGRLVGGAYEATWYLAKVDIAGSDTRGDEDRWVQALEWADSLGVHIVNSSVGFRDNFVDRAPIPYGDLDGNTTITTRAADEAARRGMLIVVAVGNGGPLPGSLWAPADADSVLAVGAIDSLTNAGVLIPTSLSSRGPSADGRTKPDLVALGAGLTAASAVVGPTGYEAGLTGSSVATPFITAGATLFMQAWPDLSSMAAREALRLSATYADQPDNNVGWGMPDVAAAVMFPQGIVVGPQGLAPTDAQGRLTTIAPRFSWSVPLVHPLMGPILYAVEVAPDSAFTSVLFRDTVRESFVFDARRPFQPVEGAWWRVVGESPLGVRRASAPRRFTVPSWVRLLTLNDPQTMFVNERRPTLSWAPLSTGQFARFTYDVQVLTLDGTVVQDVRNVEESSIRVPEVLTPNRSYRWRVIARTGAFADTVSSPAEFVIVSTDAPPATILYQNFPNPFRDFGAGGLTRIWFDLAEPAAVELAVYDSRGRLIRQLIPAKPGCGPVLLTPGLYGREEPSSSFLDDGCALFAWDGRDHSGDRAPRGVYMLRLRAGAVEDVKHIAYIPDN